MRKLSELDRWRVKGEHPWEAGDLGGAFHFKLSDDGPGFVVVASNGDGWDHVSVSTKDRCPTWEEMDRIKRLFFRPDEVAMQLHVAEADHISRHPYTLHLWRPHGTKRAIPLPPPIMV
jgi:hypothetical protein